MGSRAFRGPQESRPRKLRCGHFGPGSAEQALARLAHCVLTANVGLPHRSTREAIALAIHLVVHIDRWEGRRAVREVLAVEGYDHATDRYRLVPFTSGLASVAGGAS